MSNKTSIHFDISDLNKQIDKLHKKMGQEFPHKVSRLLEKSGYDFLDIVQNMIIRKQVVDTRLLLNSFSNVGAEGRIWELTQGGLTLRVGTNVKYARYVNDGHWTMSEKSVSGFLADGTPYRWVPGVWEGNKFRYRKGADTGMMLKWKWVEGTHYWDDAVKIFEKTFPNDFRRFIQQLVREQGV